MIKVKLVHDYTKYNEKLDKGVEGYAFETPEEQIKRKFDDCFVKVKFDGITEVDVLWRGLAIIDEVYLAEKQSIKDAYFSQMSSATNVVQVLGPKGAVRSLEFDFICDGVSTHKLIEDKSELLDYLAACEKYNVSIQTIQLEKKAREKKK